MKFISFVCKLGYKHGSVHRAGHVCQCRMLRGASFMNEGKQFTWMERTVSMCLSR